MLARPNVTKNMRSILVKYLFSSKFFSMQMRKSKADETLEEICIILSDILKATAFLPQTVTIHGFLKLVRYNCNLNRTNLRLSQINTVSLPAPQIHHASE